MTTEELKEELAAREHLRWAHWQDWMHGKCTKRPSGSLVIPASLVGRWERQIATPYEQLSDLEKQSDREQVDRYWPLIEEYIKSQLPETAWDGNTNGKRYAVLKGPSRFVGPDERKPLYYTDNKDAAWTYIEGMVSAKEFELTLWDNLIKTTIGGKLASALIDNPR